MHFQKPIPKLPVSGGRLGNLLVPVSDAADEGGEARPVAVAEEVVGGLGGLVKEAPEGELAEHRVVGVVEARVVGAAVPGLAHGQGAVVHGLEVRGVGWVLEGREVGRGAEAQARPEVEVLEEGVGFDACECVRACVRAPVVGRRRENELEMSESCMAHIAFKKLGLKV